MKGASMHYDFSWATALAAEQENAAMGCAECSAPACSHNERLWNEEASFHLAGAASRRLLRPRPVSADFARIQLNSRSMSCTARIPTCPYRKLNPVGEQRRIG